MNFDWSGFTKRDYREYLENCIDLYEDCVGNVHVGDICIDLVHDCDADILRYDFYVAHEDTGYGYKNNVLPYDYADGGAMNTPYRMSYEKFVEKAEELFEDFIRMNDKAMGGYSLVEHANRELEIW